MSTLCKSLRRLDAFGAPVNLNYNGDASFQTIPGSIASLFLFCVLIFYLCLQTLSLLNYEDPQIVNYTIKEDRNLMEEHIQLEQMDLRLAFGISNYKK